MPENQSATQESTQTTEVKIPASLGKVQRVQMAFPQDQNNTAGDSDNTNIQNNEGANATKDANNGAAAKTTAPAPTEFNEEAFKAMLESQGIKYDSLDSLKKKLTEPEYKAEPTEEDKKAAATAKEKRILDKWLSAGNTLDQYMAVKSVAESDANQFAINTAKGKLIEAGFNQEEADQLLKDQYFQIDDAEIEQEPEETDKAYKKRMKDHFAKQLAELSSPIRSKAAGILADLNAAIDSEDLQVQNEIAISAKIDEDFKTMPRKLNIEIGDIGGGTIASPLSYDVSETVLADVKNELKDPAKRQQLFLNQDGSLNLTKLADFVVKARSFDSVAKISYLESQTRTNEQWQKVFPANNPAALGVGGNGRNPNNNTPGKPATFGKSQKINTSR